MPQAILANLQTILLYIHIVTLRGLYFNAQYKKLSYKCMYVNVLLYDILFKLSDRPYITIKH